MQKNRIIIGKFLGIPISLDYSWFLIFILLTWMLAINYFPSEFKNWGQAQYWIVGAVTSLMLFASVLLHELGHSVIAMRYKIKVKQINLFIFGGISEIAGEPPKASAEFWIAAAGPIVSFLLAGIFYLISNLVIDIEILKAIFEYLAYINFILAIFNLIPGFPLDGGRVLRSIVWGVTKNLEKATNIAAGVGRAFGFLFILLGVFQIFAGNIFNGLWIAFIGWFLDSAAVSQIQQQKVHDILENHKVFEVMTKDFGIVPSDSTLQEIVDNHFLGINRRCLFVRKDGRIAGMVTLHRFNDIPKDKWGETLVEQVMIPYSDLEKVTEDADVWHALQKMNTDGVNQLPVVEDGKILGVISRDNVISFISEQKNLILSSN